MMTFRLSLSIAILAMVTITAPGFAGSGGHGGGPGGRPQASRPAGSSALGDNDVKGNSGKQEVAKRGNKGGKVRGLNRADQVAGDHGDKGRDNAAAKQSR
jgi:hypothetical protein